MDRFKGKSKAFSLLICIICACAVLIILSGKRNGTDKQQENAGIRESETTLSADSFVTDAMDSPLHSGQETVQITEPECEAVYLGIKDYGHDEINKDNIEDFIYLFEIDGEICEYRLSNGISDEEGHLDYPIQNILKEGYHYDLTEEEGTVTGAVEIASEVTPSELPVTGVPGERTLTNYLETALMPVGTTLYIYGGGWNWQDDGSSIQARTLGVSPDWMFFFEDHDADYSYRAEGSASSEGNPVTNYYPYGGFNEYYYAGLDCSGYVGWVLYNTFETENGLEGYVCSSTLMARTLSDYGFGEWTQNIKMPDDSNEYEMKPGDVMSINGHVWISLGTCDDGSIVIVHSTPSRSRTGQPGGGVQISAVGAYNCEAYLLADHYMSEYYPEWYERYPVYLCDPAVYFSFYGEYAGRFTWDVTDDDGLNDPDGIQSMDPEEVLMILFNEGR